MLRLFIVIPFLILPIVLYGLFAMTGGNEGAQAAMDRVMFSTTMMSGGDWRFTTGDMILVAGLVALFGEVLKSVRTKSDSIMNHALSLGVLVFCIIAFLAFPGFNTSVFFLILVMTLLDVVAGPVVSIVAARRDFGVSGGTL